MNRHPRSEKSYRLFFILLVSAGFLTIYFVPYIQGSLKEFAYFAGLAVLMEFWEVRLPNLPRILVAETVYTAGLFLFPLQKELLLIAIGAAGRGAYALDFKFSDLFRLLRRLVLYGGSAAYFAAAKLPESFGVLQGTTAAGEMGRALTGIGWLAGWVAAFSVCQFALGHLEKMIARRSLRVGVRWASFGGFVLFNLLIITPLGLLMFILYELDSAPFPYALSLLIPPLLVIYRSIRNYTESLEAAKSTIEALAEAVDKRLMFTISHSPKVAKISRAIALAMGLSDEEVELVIRAARIHDLGKVGIADKILNKKETLTEDEVKIIQKHPEIGARVASQLSLYVKEVEVIKCHHERWDGKGYPSGMSGETIPRAARIIAVADAFESAISDRPYRKGVTIEQAIAQVKEESGTGFDPKVVDSFLRTVERERMLADRASGR